MDEHEQNASTHSEIELERERRKWVWITFFELESTVSFRHFQLFMSIIKRLKSTVWKLFCFHLEEIFSVFNLLSSLILLWGETFVVWFRISAHFNELLAIKLAKITVYSSYATNYLFSLNTLNPHANSSHQCDFMNYMSSSSSQHVWNLNAFCGSMLLFRNVGYSKPLSHRQHIPFMFYLYSVPRAYDMKIGQRDNKLQMCYTKQTKTFTERDDTGNVSG